MVPAQPRFYFGVIKVHSLLLGSLEGWDVGASMVTLDWTHANSWDTQGHSTCPALAVLNLCQLPPEPSPSRAGSDRHVIRSGEAWDLLSLPTSLPSLSTFPCCWVMSAPNLLWGGGATAGSLQTSSPKKRKICKRCLRAFIVEGGTRQRRSDLTLPRLCWLKKIA